MKIKIYSEIKPSIYNWLPEWLEEVEI